MGLGVASECARTHPQVYVCVFAHMHKCMKLLYLYCSRFREMRPREEVRIFTTRRTEAIL